MAIRVPVFLILTVLLVRRYSRQNAASDLDLHCLPRSQNRDARLIWVNVSLHIRAISTESLLSANKNSTQRKRHTREVDEKVMIRNRHDLL